MTKMLSNEDGAVLLEPQFLKKIAAEALPIAKAHELITQEISDGRLEITGVLSEIIFTISKPEKGVVFRLDHLSFYCFGIQYLVGGDGGLYARIEDEFFAVEPGDVANEIVTFLKWRLSALERLKI